MGFPSYVHDPEAILPYQWDWATEGWLIGGDTITEATVTVADTADDDTAPVSVDSVSFDDGTVTAVVSGGTVAFSPYVLTCHIVTAAGWEDDRSIQLKVQER